MSDDYPFPASHHEVTLQPVPPHITFASTLEEIINDKVIFSFEPVDYCECGAVVDIPGGSVKAMALKLAETLPLETRVGYGVQHIYDETVNGLSEEEFIARLTAWRERNEDDNSKYLYKVFNG